MKIKVCGNTSQQQVVELDDAGITFAGFIFYPKSPRYMVNRISAEGMKQIKGKIIKIGVFVNPSHDDLMKTVEDYRLDEFEYRSHILHSGLRFKFAIHVYGEKNQDA